MALRVKPDHLMARILDNEATKKIFGTDTTIYGVRTGRTAFERAAESIKEVVDQIYLLYNNKIADNAVAVSIYKRSLKITSPRGAQIYLTESQVVAIGVFIDVFLTEWVGENGDRDSPTRSSYPLRIIGILLKDLLSNISASCVNFNAGRAGRAGNDTVEGWDLLVRGARLLGFGFHIDKLEKPVALPVEVVDAVDLIGVILDEGETNVSNH